MYVYINIYIYVYIHICIDVRDFKSDVINTVKASFEFYTYKGEGCCCYCRHNNGSTQLAIPLSCLVKNRILTMDDDNQEYLDST